MFAPSRAAIAFVLCAAALCGPSVAAGEGGLPRLYTNEQAIEDARHPPTVDIDDLKAVLRFVLAALPDRVKVHPTENYYYFFFYEGGVKYAGNFRFDVGKRDEGFVEFIYFRDTTEWEDDDRDYHARLGPADGVALTKVGDLVYDLTFEGRTVTFALNDLSNVRPPAGALRPEEKFLGPVADESGLRFYLVFDERLKVFHYVLDETPPVGDELIPAAGMSRILIGRRTGFAFFRDHAAGRNVLVGVYGGNIDVNNYFDGPFDQLPDNFLVGDELRQAIVAAGIVPPDADIDGLGIYPDDDRRVAIAPYLHYYAFDDLAPAEKCGQEKDEAAVNACLGALWKE